MKRSIALLVIAYTAIIAPFIGAAMGNAPKGPKDFDAIIKAAKPGTTINLDTNGSYVTAGTLAIPQAGLTVHFNGSTLAGPGSGTWLIPTGDHVTFFGMHVDKCPILWYPRADSCTLDTCTLGGTLVNGKFVPGDDGAIFQAVKTGPGGTRAGINNSWVSTTKTVSFYGDQGNETAKNTLFCGSLDEYVLRLDGINATDVPSGGFFSGCTFLHASGQNAKPWGGVRQHKNVQFVNCVGEGTCIRWGQQNQPPETPIGKWASGSMTNCTFNNVAGQAPIGNYQGSSLTVTGCTFNEPDSPCIVADSQSLTTFGNNVQNVTFGNKPQLFWQSLKGGQNVYTGGDVINVVQQQKK